MGGTSVPGLPARPIIDIDVVLSDYSSAHELRPALEAAGFARALAGDFADRQFYVLTEGGRHLCHLSLTNPGSATWLSHLALRERLRTDPVARRSLGGVKRRLAAEHSDPETYESAKSDLFRSFSDSGRTAVSGVPRRALLLGGLIVGGIAALAAAFAGVGYFTETSRGPDGLPDHRAVRATDLALRPEATLFYPGSAVLARATSDQGSDPANPISNPAEVDSLLVTPAAPETISAWYAQRLAASGWRFSPSSLTTEPPAGELDSEWRRGRREYFDLRLYIDRAALGSQGYAVQGLIFRAVYLVGRGP